MKITWQCGWPLSALLLGLLSGLLLSACEGDRRGDSHMTSGEHATTTAKKPVPTSGQVIYNRWCVSCHLSGVSGSPRLGRAEDWVARLPKGRATLLANLKKGLGAMPPRGLCSSCSEEELERSLDYMLEVLKP